MKCPMCQQETSAASKFCEFCGAELDRDFDYLSAELVRETEEEKIRKIEEEAQGYLAFSIFLLISSLIIYYVIPRPPKLDDAPSFVRKVQWKAKSDPKLPILIDDIPR